MAISLFILALPAYLRCTTFSETKFISFDLSFENSDQKDGPFDNENGLKVFSPPAFFTIFLLDTNLFERSSYLFSQAFSLGQKTFVLRC
jgi:hypothetical protein